MKEEPSERAKPTGFVKLYATILDSSVWLENHATVRVWIGLLAMADGEGIVVASRRGLARRVNVTPEELDEALDRLTSPDPDSTSPDHEGRRVAAIIGGWRLLNYERYRELRTSRQDQAKARKQRQRERERAAKGRGNAPSKARHAGHAMSRSSRDVRTDETRLDETRAEETQNETTTSSSLSSSAGPAVTDDAPASGRRAIEARADLAKALTAAANRGLSENPLVTDRKPLTGGRAAHELAAVAIEQGMDPAIACEAVAAIAKRYRPEGANERISSMTYFTRGVQEAWQRHKDRLATESAPRPREIFL